MTMPSDAAEGTAAIAVVVLGDMGSPPHRAVERPVRCAADKDAECEAPISCRVKDAAMTMPSDAAEGTAAIAVVVLGVVVVKLAIYGLARAAAAAPCRREASALCTLPTKAPNWRY
jgi:hypothetical protein